MAQKTTKLTREQLEGALAALWPELDGMPETAAEWSSWSAADRFDYGLEWGNLLGGLQNLADADTAGNLTPDQHERYERLVRRYEDVMPDIRRIGLGTIPVPNLAARSR